MEHFAAATEESIRETIETLPNSNASDNQNIVNNVLNLAYAFVGLVAVAFIIYAGVQYLTANGDSGKIVKAKNTIIYAVAGLVVVLLAAAITFFVTQALTTTGAPEA